MFRAATFALGFAALCTASTIEGEYIAVLSRNATSASHDLLQQKYGGSKITIGKFRAVHVTGVDAAALVELKRAEGVDYVDANMMGEIYQTTCPAVQNSPVSWGTVRTTVRTAADVGTAFRHNPRWGVGVDAYVLDTGIMCTHNDFAGRCEFGTTFVGGTNDGHGHGTHVAGTIGGTTWGISKAVNLIAVKVCTNLGLCPQAGTINAFQWVAERYQRTRRPAVVNLSLGGGFSQSYNDAANALVDVGVNVVAAAGNSNADACNSSPASALNIITVGSSDQGAQGGQQVDVRSSFSNWGSCLDIFAPGSAITSAGISSNNATAVMSGTSMACPQVAGAVSQFVSEHPNAHPAAVKLHFINSALNNIVLNPGNDSPNRLLHIACL